MNVRGAWGGNDFGDEGLSGLVVEVQSDECHAEAREEDDQALTGDGHKGPKAHSLRNVTKYGYRGKIRARL